MNVNDRVKYQRHVVEQHNDEKHYGIRLSELRGVVVSIPDRNRKVALVQWNHVPSARVMDQDSLEICGD